MRAEKEKKASVISFTKNGGDLSQKIIFYLQKEGYPCAGYQKMAASEKREGSEKENDVLSAKLLPVSSSLTEWVGEQFASVDVLIFVGAVGIAVRASAPWIRDKFSDPAVLAVDELGNFVIPLLSGHMGGANDFARMLAAALTAVPVITTATDLHGCFAVDVFAKKNNLWITDRKLAKEMSAEALKGNRIGVFADIRVKEDELAGCSTGETEKMNVYIGFWKKEKWAAGIPKENTLQLIPKVLTLGIGCRRDIEPEALKTQVMEGLAQWGIWPQAIKRLATISLKKEEKAMLALCREMGWEFCWFTPEELLAANGNFSYSAFVEKTTGVDCVCERAAVLGAKAPLLFGKCVLQGVTLAAAQDAD